MARKRNRETEEASVDMTPMLDIVFIMLIFFIVTTSFVKEAGIEINRKVLAEIAVSDPAGFTNLVEQAKAAIQ